jgi:hypothetical protein
MPRATLCGLSNRFAVRNFLLLRLFCPGSTGGYAARPDGRQQFGGNDFSNGKTPARATQGGPGHFRNDGEMCIKTRHCGPRLTLAIRTPVLDIRFASIFDAQPDNGACDGIECLDLRCGGPRRPLGRIMSHNHQGNRIAMRITLATFVLNH